MKQWLQKASVILIAIMTLGLYVPPSLVTTNAESTEENDSSVATKESIANELVDESIRLNEKALLNTLVDDQELVLDNPVVEKAKTQMLTKFGPKITEVIEDEFTSEILPPLEEVLHYIFDDTNEEATYYEITEHLTSEVGERVFNVYDYRTNKDIALFHVRRDNRPLEGYWFNFHYHLSEDGFEEHHEIGEIYWDKNVPPKWMS